MNIYTIYRATNTINGKVYIGFTSKPIEERIFQHQKTHHKYNYIFYYDIRKYGCESFSWEVLYQSKDGDHTKDVMEGFFIKENNSFIKFENSNGYNMSLGGDGRLGLRHSKKSIELMKKNRKGIPCPTWQKEHLSRLNKGKKHPPNRKSTAKSYEVTSPDDQTFVITNLTKFCKLNGLNAGAMAQVGQGNTPHHKGWKCIRLSDVL
jgi:group I intron endonuclease